MTNKTYVVTGATGAVGKVVAERLDAQGYQVRRISRRDGISSDDATALMRAFSIAAGTVATWVTLGWEVHYVTCTDASGGGPPDDAEDVSTEVHRAISQVRKHEQRVAGDLPGLS